MFVSLKLFKKIIIKRLVPVTLIVAMLFVICPATYDEFVFAIYIHGEYIGQAIAIIFFCTNSLSLQILDSDSWFLFFSITVWALR